MVVLWFSYLLLLLLKFWKYSVFLVSFLRFEIVLKQIVNQATHFITGYMFLNILFYFIKQILLDFCRYFFSLVIEFCNLNICYWKQSTSKYNFFLLLFFFKCKCKGWSKKNLTKLRLWLNLPYPLPPLGH